MYDDISCIVFRDDDRSGRIIATNVPYPYAKVGDSFWRLTELSPAKTDKLRAALDVPQGVWMVSSLGIGVLFSHFYDWLGFYVYLHIHDDPDIIRAFVLNGASDRGILPCPYGMEGEVTEINAYDADTFVRMKYRLSAIHRSRYAFCCAQNFSAVPGETVVNSLKRMQEIQKSQLTFCGVQEAFEFGAYGYDNLVSRMLYLCWLSWLASLSADEKLSAELYTCPGHEMGALCLKLRTVIPPLDTVRQREGFSSVLDAMDFLARKAELYDIDTKISWDGEASALSVDIQCLQLPNIFQPTDGKEPTRKMSAGV